MTRAPATPARATVVTPDPSAELAQVYQALEQAKRAEWRPSIAGLVGIGFLALAIHLFRSRR